MGLFGPPNVDRMKAKGDLKGLINALDYQKDAGIRAAAAKALGELRATVAVEPLVAALKDVDERVRQATVEALGSLCNPRVAAMLIQALNDGSELVRLAAANALHRNADCTVQPLIAALGVADTRAAATDLLLHLDVPITGPLIQALRKGPRREVVELLARIGECTVGPLVTALGDTDSGVRQAAVEALAKVGAPAREPLVIALQHHNWVAREAAGMALSKIGLPQDSTVQTWHAVISKDWARAIALGAPAVEPLIAALEDHDQSLREGAVLALGKIKDARATQPLTLLLRDPRHSSTRQAAAIALGEIGNAQAVDPLIAALRDSQRNVRQCAAAALGAIKDTRAVMPLISALQDSDPNMRQSCILALGEIRAGRSVEPLLGALNDENENVRQAAIQSLSKVGMPAVGPLLTALRHSRWYVRSNAALALGKIRDVRSREPLIAALNDPDLPVRQAAAVALGELKDRQSVSALIKVLQTDRGGPRIAAAVALGEIGYERAVEPLVEAMTNRLDADVRQAAAMALAHIGTPALPPLLVALRDTDSDVRLTAAKALDKVGWQPDVANAGWYWVAKQEWDQCVALGASAVEALVARHTDLNEAVRQAASKALTKIGSQAVEPLLALLGNAELRSVVAQSLAALYREGQLSYVSKQLILAHRKELLVHEDEHYDREHNCGHSDNHSDIDRPVSLI